jgi:acyl carrier protein
MNDAAAIATSVRAALAAGLAVEDSALQPDTDLYDDLCADSIAVMEVLCVLEEQLDIELPESNAFAIDLRTVGDVIEAFQMRGIDRCRRSAGSHERSK